MGSGLANDSRQNLMAAYEMAVREAKDRPRPRKEAWGGIDPAGEGT
jgi:hypothetical protein